MEIRIFYKGVDTLTICMNIRVFPRVYPLDLYGNTHILQRGTLRICLEIPIFPKRHPLDLYGNTHILQGGYPWDLYEHT